MVVNFNRNWKFKKSDSSSYRNVDLPHDAMIHEERDPKSPGGSANAYFPGGIYEYEKTFFAPQEWEQKNVTFEFEGVYRNSKVYINGKEAGEWAYGYTNFYVEADKFLSYGLDNSIKVVADNSKLPNSRWYTGSGIYRPVNLIVKNKTHIEIDGVKISTLSFNPAKVKVFTTANGGEVKVEILYQGKAVAAGEGNDITLEIPQAKLWSEENPALYECKVTLMENNQIIDEVIESFGIRVVEWSTKGLFINGKKTLLRGGCIHHDNGILGACNFDKSEERRVRIMKQAGFNSIRMSHNPISKAMLRACDKHGIYVMDETFDMWAMKKSKYDYSLDFEAWHDRDIKAMVDKDFNHPSVIMYSIGNEVADPSTDKGVAIAKQMIEYIKTMDKTRAVTGGINLMIISMAAKGKGIYKEDGGLSGKAGKEENKEKKEKASGSLFFNMMTSMVGTSMNKMANGDKADQVTSPVLDALDIAGYNYASGRYKLEAKKHPSRIVVGSETFPQDIAKNWAMVKEIPYLVGDFMWAGWDYLGEVGIGAWSYTGGGFTKPHPWILAGTGAIDILGDIGAEAKYAAAVWGLEKKPVICVKPVNKTTRPTKSVWRGTNAVESWSWKNCDGNRAEVEVYSDAPVVEVLINGKSIGKKKTKGCQAIFKSKYQAGTVCAVAYDENNREISRSELVSATGTTQISAVAEENEIKAGDIAYINISLTGKNGIVESNDDHKLTVTVDGGKLLGFGSANPCTPERYDSGSFTTYYGRSLAVVYGEKAGTLNITVAGDKLEKQTLKIKVTD